MKWCKARRISKILVHETAKVDDNASYCSVIFTFVDVDSLNLIFALLSFEGGASNWLEPELLFVPDTLSNLGGMFVIA